MILRSVEWCSELGHVSPWCKQHDNKASKIGTKRTQKEILIQCSFLKLAHLEGSRESKWAIQRHQLCAGVFILTFSTTTWSTPLTRSWSPINIGQLRIAPPHEQHRIADYSTTVPLSVLQRFLNCIYMSHNIDLIASLKSIGTFDPQPIQSLALRLFRLSPQPLRFIIIPAFDAMSRCHKHGRLWRNRQLICRRPSSKWDPQTHP